MSEDEALDAVFAEFRTRIHAEVRAVIARIADNGMLMLGCFDEDGNSTADATWKVEFSFDAEDFAADDDELYGQIVEKKTLRDLVELELSDHGGYNPDNPPDADDFLRERRFLFGVLKLLDEFDEAGSRP